MPLLQGIRNTAATIKNAIVNAWQGEDHAQAVALGITIGEKIARFAPRGLGYHPNLDQTNEGEVQRRAYPKMVAEPSIKAALYSKLFAVASLELSVQPAEDDPNGAQTAAFVRHALTACRGGSRKLIESITLPGLIAGYSLCGKIWKQEDRGKYAGKVVLADLKSYDPNDYWLEIDGFKNIIAVTSRLDNKRYPLTEFAHWAHMPLYENPHGTSDLRAAYRQYTIIGLAWKYWAIVLERYTLPLLKGKYPKDKDVKFQRAIEEAMKNAKANGYISYPDGSDVEALEMALNAGPAFHLAIDDLQKEAFLGITFSYLQALEGSKTGARAMGQVHQSSSELLVWYLADCAAGVLNDQVVPQLIDWNYGAGVPYPKVSFGSVNDEDLLPSLQLDQGLMGMGLALSKKAAYARYNREMPLDELDAIRQQAPPGGAGALPFEEVEEFNSPYVGPKGGKGYITDAGNVVYGPMPAEGKDKPKEDKGKPSAKKPDPAKPKEKAPAEGKRTPEPKLSEKAQRAKAAHVMVDKSVQRYTEEYNEPRVARALGGASFPNGEPTDFQIPKDKGHAKAWADATDKYRADMKTWEAGGKKGERPAMAALPGEAGHGGELKTIVLGKNDKLTLNRYARVRKIAWESEHGVPFHTVVVDDRAVFNANGPGQHDESKRVIYYRRGVAGSDRLTSLHKVEGGMEGVRKLMEMPEEQLPPGAQRTDAELRVGKWKFIDDKNGRRFVNSKTGEVVRPKK